MSASNEYEFDDCGENERQNDKRKLPQSSKSPQSSERPIKRRKRTPRDTNAPRMPLNGYVRFLNAHRERAKQSHPNLSFAEITKLLASEWSSLPVEEKKQYLDEAERAKEKYLKELNEYQQTEAYHEYVKKHKEQKSLTNKKVIDGDKNGHDSNANVQPSEDTEMSDMIIQMDTSPLDLPIFTEEFLDHNKQREQELRQLRKLNTEYEEQNAILSKHIDNMKSAIEKLEVESVQQKNNNIALNQHLTHLRAVLAKSFVGIAIPGSGETPNLDNIDDYMRKLHTKLTKEKTRDCDALLEKVQTIVANLDCNFH